MADDLESQVVPSPVVDTANIAQEDSENPNKSKDPAHAEEDRYAHHRALARAAQRRFRMKLKKRRKDEERHPIFMERPNWSIQILYPVEKHKNYVDVYQQFGHLHFHLVSPDVDITYFGASGFGGHSSNETGLSDPRRIVLRAVEDRLGKYSTEVRTALNHITADDLNDVRSVPVRNWLCNAQLSPLVKDYGGWTDLDGLKSYLCDVKALLEDSDSILWLDSTIGEILGLPQ